MCVGLRGLTCACADAYNFASVAIVLKVLKGNDEERAGLLSTGREEDISRAQPGTARSARALTTHGCQFLLYSCFTHAPKLKALRG